MCVEGGIEEEERRKKGVGTFYHRYNWDAVIALLMVSNFSNDNDNGVPIFKKYQYQFMR